MRGANSRPCAVKLRFCPNSNDLLYPKEDRDRKKLIYACRNCEYKVDAIDHCVYRHSIHHTSAETTTIIQDVRTDPTLPRSSDVHCPSCDHGEAVFFSLTTSEGMSLFFQCVACAAKWKDEGSAIWKRCRLEVIEYTLSCLFPIPLSRVRCKETGQQFHYCIVLWDQIYKVRLRAIYKTDHDTQSSSIARSWPIWPQIVRLRQGAKAT